MRRLEKTTLREASMGAGFRLLRCLLAATVAVSVAACGSKITEQNYARLTSGMTQQEVEEILGAPTESKTLAIGSLSGTLATWKGKDGSTISVQFLNGKVMGKEFVKSGSQGTRGPTRRLVV